MKAIRIFSIALARFFLSAIFLSGAVTKIIHWQSTEKSTMKVFCKWQTYVGFSNGGIQECFGPLISGTPVLLIVATLLELVGGLLILLGIKEKLGAILLILFLVPVTLIMHAFWMVEGSERELQTIMFLKNLAILGGLMMLLLKPFVPPQNPGFPVKF